MGLFKIYNRFGIFVREKDLEKNKELQFEKNGFPDGWAKIILDDYVSIAGRIGWRGLKRSEYTDVGPFLLAVKDITEGGQIDYKGVKDHLSKFRYDESPEIKLQKHDILVTKDGTIGKIGYVDKLPSPTTVNSSILVVRPNVTIFPKYLFYYFRSHFFQKIVQEKIKGIAIPHLFQYDIKKFHLLIAPLPEQHRIVSKIESIFAQIDACRSKLEKLVSQTQSAQGSLAQLKNSILKQAFEGKLVPQDPNDESAELTLKKIDNTVEFGKKGLPVGWITMKFENIKPHGDAFDPVKEKNEKYIGLEHLEKNTGKISGYSDSSTTSSTKTRFVKGDLLYGKLRPYLSKVAIAEFDGVCSTDILVFPQTPIMINKILKFCLLKSDFVQFANNTVTGTQHPRTNHKKLSSYDLMVPPLREQHRIVSKIESIFAKIDVMCRTIRLKIVSRFRTSGILHGQVLRLSGAAI